MAKKRALKKPMGAPTKYKDEYCLDLIEHMARGYSFESFAGKLRVNPDSLYEWQHRYSDFSEAHKIGQSASQYFWEGLGIDNMVTSDTKFSQAVWIFTMKARFGWRDSDNDEVQALLELRRSQRASERLSHLDKASMVELFMQKSHEMRLLNDAENAKVLELGVAPDDDITGTQG